MKSSNALKRKTIESSGNGGDHVGVAVKKSANGTVKTNQKAFEKERTQVQPRVQMQAPPTKIKLQLFPIDEVTQWGLEKDGYNPFLELTLSARKKISSVVLRLITKWGTSHVANGQLVLFPHNTKIEQAASCRRWTLSDSAITTKEVYAAVGYPPTFRLRYGWLPNPQQKFVHVPPNSYDKDLKGKNDFVGVLDIPNHRKKHSDEVTDAIPEQTGATEVLHSNIIELNVLNAPTNLVDNTVATDSVPLSSTLPWNDSLTNLSIGGFLSDISMQEKISSTPNLNPENGTGMKLISDRSMSRLFSEASLLRKFGTNTAMRSENESLPRLLVPPSEASVGGLLSEASLQGKIGENFTHSNNNIKSCHEATKSILDSDETCHAFAFPGTSTL